MNQTIRNSGGKSAAHSRSGRVFRRSLTPTLALLAAMTLGLVVPVAASAQIPSINIIGGGGGGGGGAQADVGGVSSSGGAAGSPNGVAGGGASETIDGAGGDGGAGSTTAGGSASGRHGGSGGYTERSIGDDVYVDIDIKGGGGGGGGQGGAINSGGQGGSGGYARVVGAAGTTTILTGDLSVTSGANGLSGAHANVPGLNSGGAGGVGGSAIFEHYGTFLMDGGPTHNLRFNSTSSSGVVRVEINNLHLTNNATANMIESGLVDGYDWISFNTISLTNGGKFNVTTATDWNDWRNPGVFTFSNLYVAGYQNQLNLSISSNNAYTPGLVGGKLHFVMDNSIVPNSANPLLTVGNLMNGTSGLSLAGFDPNNLVMVSQYGGYYTGLAEGQSVLLADNVNDSTRVFTNGFRSVQHKGGLRFEDFNISTSGVATNAQLSATYGGKAQSVRTGEAFTPYFQGHMASLYAVSGGSRPVLEQATKALVDTPTSVGEPLISLYATGSEVTLETGSSVDVESYGGVLAVGTKFNNSAGLTTVAGFGEFGTGSYDTYKHIADLYAFNNGRFVGSGDTDYAGGGVFVHHLFDANHFAGGFSLEGSLRVGNVKNKFSMDMLDRSGYDISRRYWGGHLGLGYNYLLTNMDSIDFFGQVHMAHVENGTFNSSAGERIHFLAAKSTVSRLGGRYNHNFNELLKGYATAAWEHEFEGDVGGSVDRTRIQKSPNIEGSSGFGQLGLNVKSANNPVSLDLSVFGVAGQQEGYGGTIGLKLDF